MGWNNTGLDHSNSVHLIGLFPTDFSIANTDHDGSRSNDPALYPEGLQFDSLAGQWVSVSIPVGSNDSAVPQTRSLTHHVTWRSFRFSKRYCSRHGSYGMWLRKHTASHPGRCERPSTPFPIRPKPITQTNKFGVFKLQTALSNCPEIQLNRYGKRLKTDTQNYLQMYTKRKVIRPAFERYTVPM